MACQLNSLYQLCQSRCRHGKMCVAYSGTEVNSGVNRYVFGFQYPE